METIGRHYISPGSPGAVTNRPRPTEATDVPKEGAETDATAGILAA